MKDLNIHIGDQSENGQVTIVDEDRLCYLVRSESKGAVGLRTISKVLLKEFVELYEKRHDVTANEARDLLCGKSDVDKFEYGYASTLLQMAKMAANSRNWILSSDPSYYDTLGAFRKYKFVDWSWLSPNAKVGDVVYIYLSNSEKRIALKTKIAILDVPKEILTDDKQFYVNPNDAVDDGRKYTRLELVKEETTGMLTLENLVLHGLNGRLQGPRKVSGDLLKYIESFFNNDPLQVIYYGAPGTGKSHKIKEKLEGENVPKANIFRTTFHPDSDYSTFVGAYKPTRGKKFLYGLNQKETILYKGEDNQPIQEDVITYNFVPQAFLQAYIRAYEVPNEKVYLVIEEINRGNCAQIFGDLFQLLDRDGNGKSDYTIKADSDLRTFLEDEFKKLGVGDDGIKDGELCLPPNLYIYATMNTSDQSLFPIDSAFKRRWDWEYEPIKYKNKDWKIVIGSSEYSWVSFQRAVNDKVKEATSSEDKMLGDYFVNPSDGIVTDKILLNKVLFYLWNDVCKDGEGEIFKTNETTEVTFSELYGEEGRQKLIQMMEYLKVEKVLATETGDEEDNDDEDGANNPRKDFTKYSINGDNNNGKGYSKKILAAKLVEKYIEQNEGVSADEVVRNWNSLGYFVSHFVETQSEHDARTDNSPRVERISCNNGEAVYVSTNGWGGQGVMDRLINSIPREWNLTVEKL